MTMRTCRQINDDIQKIFDEVKIHPDGPGEEAFWNAYEDISKMTKPLSLKLYNLGREWERSARLRLWN